MVIIDWEEMIFVRAMNGQRVTKILELVDIAAESHRRRVSTSVINDVIEDAVKWHNPPTTRGGKQGKLYYGTQVSSQPPTIALFVNDPQRFNDNYLRLFEGQFRPQVGFKGTPNRLNWPG